MSMCKTLQVSAFPGRWRSLCRRRREVICSSSSPHSFRSSGSSGLYEGGRLACTFFKSRFRPMHSQHPPSSLCSSPSCWKIRYLRACIAFNPCFSRLSSSVGLFRLFLTARVSTTGRRSSKTVPSGATGCPLRNRLPLGRILGSTMPLGPWGRRDSATPTETTPRPYPLPLPCTCGAHSISKI